MTDLPQNITIRRSDHPDFDRIDPKKAGVARTLPPTLEAAGLTTGPVRGLYAHIPFCFHKCHYCDFYSIVDRRGRQDAFVDRLIEEIHTVGSSLTRPLETIFVGGGTPTLLGAEPWRRITAAIRDALPLDEACEFTVEANPETVDQPLADALAAGGVNRISIGAQSFNPTHLKTLERWHDPANVARSMQRLRTAGIDNLNLDLIFAIPGQRIDEWRDDLDHALHLEPSHLSCYNLTYEPNTAMTARLGAGDFEPVDPDTEAAMYELTADHLSAAGFAQEEISNWARPGRSCRHNLLYWRNESWLTVGPGAAGHIDGLRWKNAPRLDDYIDRRPWPSIVDVEQLDEDGRIGETLMLGLRLHEGVAGDRLDDLLSRGTRASRRRAAVDDALARGWLERTDDRSIRLTDTGRLLSDSLFAELL